MLLKQVLKSAKKQTLYEKTETDFMLLRQALKSAKNKHCMRRQTDFYVIKTGLEACKKTKKNTV